MVTGTPVEDQHVTRGKASETEQDHMIVLVGEDVHPPLPLTVIEVLNL